MIAHAPELEKAKFNLETSLIRWHELQRFFASGLVIVVDNQLDLVEVAYQFSIDNTALVENWLKTAHVSHVSDQQAREWWENDAKVWAVVVKPWILIQTSRQASSSTE